MDEELILPLTELEELLDDRSEEEVDDVEVELLLEPDEALELVLVDELEALPMLDDTDVDEDVLTCLFDPESTTAPPPEHAPSENASNVHVAEKRR